MSRDDGGQIPHGWYGTKQQPRPIRDSGFTRCYSLPVFLSRLHESTIDQPHLSIKPTMSSFLCLVAERRVLLRLPRHRSAHTSTRAPLLGPVWHRGATPGLYITFIYMYNQVSPTCERLKQTPQSYHDSISEKCNKSL